MSNKRQYVTRYVPTYVNRDGLRTLMLSAQGRYTYATREEAEKILDGIVNNPTNGSGLLGSIFGDDPRFEVRACECWKGHNDPVGIYFDTNEDKQS